MDDQCWDRNGPWGAFGEPHQWRQRSRSLHIAAKAVWTEAESPKNSDRPAQLRATAFMLIGLALENACKGLILLCDKDKVDLRSCGSLPKSIKTHNVVQLLGDVGVDVETNEQSFFADLQDYISWYGRYPIAMKPNDSVAMNLIIHDEKSWKAAIDTLSVLDSRYDDI